MKHRCGNPDCNRPFGLIRWSWYCEQFCSAKCRDGYKRQRERNKAYWKWLYKSPASLA
jgi:hypothetical protein